MNLFQRLIENPLFFKWVFYPSPEIDAYWDHYLEIHPEEASQIILLKKQIELHLTYEDKKLTDLEKKMLAKKIVMVIEKSDRNKKWYNNIYQLMRYAAVGLLFFLIGGSLVYFYLDGRQPRMVIENTALPAQVQDPVLIIGEGDQIAINRGESQLEYSEKGEITLNKEQTIKKETEEKLPEMNTLVIPYGSRSVITLADGSRVWLNAGSRLIYPSRFVDKTREVFLTGEAFFDISENGKQPFVVKTSDLNVQVLGTRFNVSAYPEDYSVQTVLVEGSVEIKRTKAGMFEKPVKLAPGQLGYFNKKTSVTQIYNVDIQEYTLWTEGLFSFSNTDLSRIMKKLERYYNIRFQFDDPFKGSIQITGKMDVTKGREEVFEYLSKLTGLEFLPVNERHYIIR